MYKVVVSLVTTLVTIQMNVSIFKFKVFATVIVSILVTDVVVALYDTLIIYSM